MSGMSAQELVQYKLQPALDECALHHLRLHQAWSEAIGFDFMRSAGVVALADHQVRTLDQLVFRFGRLQDAMGTRLMPALLRLMQEWADNEPFIDKLNRAEKLGILTSAEQWQLLRELRNQTAHEYPAQPELMLENLRHLVRHVPMLEQAHMQMDGFAQLRKTGV